MSNEDVAAVVAAVLFSAFGAWVGDAFWAALFGGASAGLIVALGAVVEHRK